PVVAHRGEPRRRRSRATKLLHVRRAFHVRVSSRPRESLISPVVLMAGRRGPGLRRTQWLREFTQLRKLQKLRKLGRPRNRPFTGKRFLAERSEERRVGKECRSRWGRYH